MLDLNLKNIQFLETSFFNNSVLDWLMAATMVIIIFTGLLIIKKVILIRLKKLSILKNFDWMEALLKSLSEAKLFILLIISAYLGVKELNIPETVQDYIRIAAFAAFFVQIGLWLRSLLNIWLAAYRKEQMKNNPAALSALGALRFASHSLIWLTVVLLILDNVGFDVTTLIAGLGIGGIAIALAVQNILGDLFASLSIILDKTFVVGDFVIIDEYLGVVESIGLKTTRIRSLSGEQIVFANADLLNGRIRNYGRMYERRVSVKIGVTYDTAREKLKMIPDIIKDAISQQDDIRFDRAHFFQYGDFSLDFEYVYYILSPDYNKYMDIQQDINLIIHEKFEEQNIEFAFPTRTVHLQNAAHDRNSA